MNQLHTIFILLALVASVGIIGNFLIESADAWHTQFATKKECTNFMKTTIGNTTSEANAMCQKVVPH
mgnify:CR=1 FL=1